MNFWRAISFSIFLLAAPAMVAAQGGNAAMGQAPAAPSNISSQSVRILSPKSGQKITQDYIDVRFELTNPGATVNTPTFQVQLDSNDPVQTTSSDQTFSGLNPGTHTLSVELVDANGTPINGSRAQVQFVVTPQTSPSQPTVTPRSGNQPGTQPPHLETVALTQTSAAPAQGSKRQGTQQKSSNDDALPQSGSVLPLMSLIGFGVLLGGITSALKTR